MPVTRLVAGYIHSLILPIDVAPPSQCTSPYWLLLQLIPRLIEFTHGEGEGLSELSRQR